MKKNLEQYLKEQLKNGIIDHDIRASLNDDGNVTFYIHPRNANGDTLDFIVGGNELIQINNK